MVLDALTAVRRRYAEDVTAAASVRCPSLTEALAHVPRERFLPAGPWRVQAEGEPLGGRMTPDADPRHVYQDASIAIDAERQLFNGAPSAVAPWIDALHIRPGDRVLHIGCGLGYYTAILAHMVGPAGGVLAVEVDETLAASAASNLEPWNWVSVRRDDGREVGDASFDVILVHAGVTHPQRGWLEALGGGGQGRLLLPLTCTFPQLGPLGKGYAFVMSATDTPHIFAAHALSVVMIYSAVGLRDEDVNSRLGRALMSGGVSAVQRLRRDVHVPDGTCWLHEDGWCLSTG